MNLVGSEISKAGSTSSGGALDGFGRWQLDSFRVENETLLMRCWIRGGLGGGVYEQCKRTHPYRFDASGGPPSKGHSIHSVCYDMYNRRKGLP